MAVKERSQIKGTDAQIKAFAGHNGVLAFATDTKSLHVLSGTAGTTTEFLPSTKLATVATSGSYNDLTGKPVVDSALSATSENPVQNKVINSALDGKLSTSGGTVNGPVTIASTITTSGLARHAGVKEFVIGGKDNDGCLHLYPGETANYSSKKSASLILTSTDYTGITITEGGAFRLNAMNAATGNKSLSGSPSGSLTWCGHEVARVVSSGKSADGTQWYRKYNDGYIEQAGLFDNGSDARGFTTSITFLAPFSSSVYSVQVTPGSTNTTNWDGTVIARAFTTTSMTIAFWGNSDPIRARYLYWFACGY